MAKQDIELKKTESVLGELTRLHDEISRRAYAFFQNADSFGGALADWLRAERELVWRPAIELRQRDGAFELEVAVAGVDPKELDIQVAPQDILIKANSQHRHEDATGTVHLCEFESGQLFRSVHLPQTIDPDSVKAEYRHGVVRLTAKIAKAAPRKINIKAA